MKTIGVKEHNTKRLIESVILPFMLIPLVLAIISLIFGIYEHILFLVSISVIATLILVVYTLITLYLEYRRIKGETRYEQGRT